jgi:hypothetical protein
LSRMEVDCTVHNRGNDNHAHSLFRPQSHARQLLSTRVFKSYEDILDHCCFAWNKLIDMPWKIMSIGTGLGLSVVIRR